MLRCLGLLFIKTFFCCLFAPLILLNVACAYYNHGSEVFKKKHHRLPEKLTKDYEHKFIQLSSVKLHYVEEGSASAPLMLFIHGFPEFWYSWRYQIKHFAKSYRVVAMDMRGYGESEKPVGKENYKTSILARDIKELITALGEQRAIVVAHDWGAIAAWYASVIYPEAIHRLVILNVPHPGAVDSIVAQNPWQIVRSWYIFFFQTPFLPEFVFGFNDMEKLGDMLSKGMKNRANFTAEDIEAWKATFGAEGAGFTPPMNYYRALLSYPKPEEVNRLTKAPTLIIWGEEDVALVKDCAPLSAKRCENAEVVFVPNASHWVQQDEPQIVNKAIEEFLAKKN